MKLIRTLETYWRQPRFYWPLTVIIAAATPLTFAPYYHFWLMPLLFGALVRLTELRPERAAATAYLYGLVGYAAQFYWIHTAMHDVSGLSNLYAVPITFLLPAFLALYPALCFRLLRMFRYPRAVNIGIILPLLWTLAEFARERLLTGFGWGALGYSQIVPNSPLAGFAPVGGIHLVTLATACTGAWLVLLIDNTGRLKKRLLPLAGIAALCGTGYALQQTDFTRPDGSTATVALIQGNIEQTFKWHEDQIVPTIQKYYALLGQTKADIVIMPETAIPVMRQDLPPDVLVKFAEQADGNNSALALGISQYTADGGGYENAVVNLSGYRDGGKTPPYYAKDHLVPFGEYKPLKFITEPLYRLMDMPLADFRRGGGRQMPLEIKNQKIAFNICYEDGFGDDLIATAKHSTLLANASNLAWFGGSNAMYQQLQQSQARAMELGRYMVRATNTGATAIVSPKGAVLAAAEPNTDAVLEGIVKGHTGQTPYMKLGGSWPLICLLAGTVLFLYLLQKKQK